LNEALNDVADILDCVQCSISKQCLDSLRDNIQRKTKAYTTIQECV
jgi:hypothetical protein